jgi:hypothetical protein
MEPALTMAWIPCSASRVCAQISWKPLTRGIRTGLVLGRLSHGHLMATHSNGISISAHATAKTARARLLQVRRLLCGKLRAVRISHRTARRSPPRCMAKPTAGRPTPAPPTSGTCPMSSAPWSPMSVHGVHGAFSNAKTRALGVYHGPRRQQLENYLDIRLPFQPTPNAFLLAIARPQALI